ncbi:MAG: GntR family transcriptional regulator [Clostridium sp.]|nr:GntR family transcriptional regulator [Clostridium sp.]
MSWEFDNSSPIYKQIIKEMELRIVSGIYKSGEKLESVRDMAKKASVNPNTMQKALTELEKTGLIYSQRTSGRFITEDIDMIKEVKISLAKDKVEQFINGMKSLGFSKEEIISIVEDVAKEVN